MSKTFGYLRSLVCTVIISEQAYPMQCQVSSDVVFTNDLEREALFFLRIGNATSWVLDRFTVIGIPLSIN